jgi:hypothetical protein
MSLLQRDGHVKGPSYQIERDDSLSMTWQDIGRNLASTFEGFCSTHDTSLFLPIDTKPFDVTDQQQSFLYAYRAVARELHSTMEAAIRVQSMYQKRVEAGIDTGDQPERAGLMAVERMLHAHSTFVYKSKLDRALVNEQYDVLTHTVITFTAQSPAVAASAFFDLDTRPNDEEAPRVALNIFAISKDETIAVFSYMEKDGETVEEYIRDVSESEGLYQKYRLSRMLLMHAENFVIAPSLFDTWSPEKRSVILDFFRETLKFGSSRESEHLYLF